MEEKQIVLNKAKCLSCGDVVTSFGVHDYITCSCGALSVDGGTAYLKRAYDDSTMVEELSIYNDAPFEVIRENFYRGGRGKNNDEPLKWVPLNEMSDEWIKNCIIYNDDRGLSKSMANYFYTKELRHRQRMGISIADK